MTTPPPSGTILAVTGTAAAPIEALRVSGSGPSRPLRGISGQPLVAAEGTYWVQTLVPDGATGEMSDAEEVVGQAGAETRVLLRGAAEPQVAAPAEAGPAPASRPGGHAMQSALAVITAAAAGMLRSIAALRPGAASPSAGTPLAAPSAGLRRWTGDPAPPLTFPGRSSMFAIAVDGREFLAVTPGAVGITTTATVTPKLSDTAGAPGFPSVGLLFGDPVLDQLWQFTAAGSMGLARVMADAVVQQGEAARGLHAALACYVLMRIGWDGDLLGFAATALRTTPHQPDLLVIKAELLARQGRHGDAASCLAALGTGSEPWPLLRPGIEYARKRICIALESESGGAGLTAVAPQIMLIAAMMDPGALNLVLRTADAERMAALLYGVSSPAEPAPRPPAPAAIHPPG